MCGYNTSTNEYKSNGFSRIDKISIEQVRSCLASLVSYPCCDTTNVQAKENGIYIQLIKLNKIV